MANWLDEDVDGLLDELDDLEHGQKGNARRLGAKQGRRARAEPEVDADEEEAMPANDITPSLNDSGPPKPSRRVGGWGAESGKRPRRGVTEDIEDERLRPRSPEQDDDSDNDIPVIPDLEDQHEEDLTTQVAQAPNVAINRVATYRELDNDLLRHAAFVTLDNEIDLKLLAKGLAGEADVQEEDKPWDWDRLFTEVSSELISEMEVNNDEQEDGEKTTAA